MNGYWHGSYEGTNSGQIVVEVDDRGDHFHGCVYVYDSKASMPSTFAVLKTSDKANETSFKVSLQPLNPDTAEPTVWQQISGRYPGVNFPTEADVSCRWGSKSLMLRWRTDIGTAGTARLFKNQVERRSEYKVLPIKNWAQFKEFATQLGHGDFIYRGQNKTSRLRTPFHRTGRGDIQRFLMIDIKTLHAHLSARTSHFFDMRCRIRDEHLIARAAADPARQ